MITRSDCDSNGSFRHYFYVLRGEYIIPVTPKPGWFSRPVRHDDMYARGLNSPRTASGKKPNKRLIFSQSMIIDVDPREVRSVTACISNSD